MSAKPFIFISYSRKDQRFVDELRTFLRPFEDSIDVQVWDDREISVGDKWHDQINRALEAAEIAILLISPDYLGSRWITDHELPRLLQKAEKGELRILPIIIRPAPWVHTPLAYYQMLPRDGKALSQLSASERDRAWMEFSNFLTGVLHQHDEQSISATSGKSEVLKQQTPDRASPEIAGLSTHHDDNGLFFISHAKEDGDFAENLKARMAATGLLGWIDIDVLEAGTDWRQEIDDAILKSHAVILILSPDSKASEYVTYEWAFGLGSGLRVVPLLLRETPIHPRLEAFQYLDFTNRRARPWNRLFTLLAELAGPKGTKLN